MHSYCELCSSEELTFHEKKDAKSNTSLDITHCLNCGLIKQKDIPTDEDLKIYYSHNYRQDYKSTYSPKPKYVQRAGQAAIDRIKFLEKYIKINNQVLIDVGAGGGEFVYIAKQSGFNSSGIEPNLGYSNFSKEQYGVNVKTAMLADVEDSSADVLTLFHVFEHMAKPHDVMKKFYQSIKDNGYLFIEVPNILQSDASPHNIYFKAHLFYYSKHTLISVASRHFDVVHVEDQGNLRILFRKRTNILETIYLPTKDELKTSQQRLNKKGWFEYLFVAGGLIKPILRIERIISEYLISKKKPREILDQLLDDKQKVADVLNKRSLKRAGGWSAAGGFGFLCFEAFF